MLIEHLEGPTLRRLVKRGGPLPPEQLLPLVMHVAAALHYMGEEGMVHLDVKPANIIMGVPPRLIDLSVARTFDRAARIAGPIGTDPYMAPEQCDPEAYPGAIGPPTDVWGIGATAWWALLGRAPFPREHGRARLRRPARALPAARARPRAAAAARSRARRGACCGRCWTRIRRTGPRRPRPWRELEPVVAAMPSKLVLAKRGARFR